MADFGFFNAGLIFTAFAATMIIIYAAWKKGEINAHASYVKEPYACGEPYHKWVAEEEYLYAKLYKTLGLKKLDLMQKEDLDEYLSWMFAAVIAAMVLLSLWGV